MFFFASRIVGSNEAQRVEQKFKELNQLVDKLIEDLYKEWASNVTEASKFNLNQNLITRNPKNSLIQLNFHPQVCQTNFCRHDFRIDFLIFLARDCSP